MLHTDPDVIDLIDRALAEDHAHNDITTSAIIPPEAAGKALLKSKAAGVLAGIEVALTVFHRVDSSLKTRAWLQDGAAIHSGALMAEVQGNLDSILRAERTSLNFLQHLSGIATDTSHYVEAVKGCKAVIVDTRKMTPGLRALEKYAVTVGGGRNHRMNLEDGVLIKDNHIATLRAQGFSLKDMVQKALEKIPSDIDVEVEATSMEEAREALDAGAHIIMLDNMPVKEMGRAVKMVDGRARLEASGGITLSNVREVADTGVDFISVGALTHSVKALDVSLDLETL